jgi:hypothetical protein
MTTGLEKVDPFSGTSVVNGLGIKLNATFTNRCQQNGGHCGNG